MNFNCLKDHGATHAQMTRAIWPDNPEKHSDIKQLWFNVSGPNGSLCGYLDPNAFEDVCKALGVTKGTDQP